MMPLIKTQLCVILMVGRLYTHAQKPLDTLMCKDPSTCCSNDPTPAGVMISHIHPKHEWMVSYKYMNMGMKGLMEGSDVVNEEEVFTNYLMAPDQMFMEMHMLMAMYGVTNRLTLMAMLNYTRQSMEMSMFTTGGHHHGGVTDASGAHVMKTAGIGDIKLYALYGILQKPHHEVLAGLGMNIPSGSTALKGEPGDMMYPNKRLPYAMQTGSGTYDLMPCINYLYRQKKTAMGAQLSSVIRTGYNHIGYRLGNELALNSWLAYQWLKQVSSSVRVEGILSDNISGNDPFIYKYNEPSANAVNYGGKKVTCYIGSVLRAKEGAFNQCSFGLEYGIPVYQYANGIQMDLLYTFNASLSIGF
jgi:hypothetical protein